MFLFLACSSPTPTSWKAFILAFTTLQIEIQYYMRQIREHSASLTLTNVSGNQKTPVYYNYFNDDAWIFHGPSVLQLYTCQRTCLHNVWIGLFTLYCAILPSFSSSFFLVTQQHPVWVPQGSARLFLRLPNPHHQAGFVHQTLLFHSEIKRMNIKGVLHVMYSVPSNFGLISKKLLKQTKHMRTHRH